MQPGPHVEEMEAAIRADGEGLRALLDGDEDRGRERLREAVARYRASWELAPPRSFGRLVGMLKAAVIAGDAADAAAYAPEQAGEGDSPPSAYVLAMAALVRGDDAAARAAAGGMRAGSPAFVRAADAIEALAAGRRRGLRERPRGDRRRLRGARGAPHRRPRRRHRADARAARRAARPGRAPVQPAAALTRRAETGVVRPEAEQLRSRAQLRAWRIASASFVLALKAALSARSGGEPSEAAGRAAADVHLVEDDEVRRDRAVAQREARPSRRARSLGRRSRYPPNGRPCGCRSAASARTRLVILDHAGRPPCGSRGARRTAPKWPRSRRLPRQVGRGTARTVGRP